MQAVIMAGGKGTRLATIRNDIPKSMIPICEIPLLVHQIENLRENNIRNIILVTGYLGNIIKEYFDDGSNFGVNITYFEEEIPLGTAGALAFLHKSLENDFILLFGDLFIDINFIKFYNYHQQRGGLATLYVHPNSHPYDSDIVITDTKDRIVDWKAKNSPRNDYYKNLVNAGIYILKKELVHYIQKDKKMDLETDVIVPIIGTEAIYAYPCTEYVKDIGTPQRLSHVERDITNGICQKRNLKNKQKCIFIDRDGTVNKLVGFLNKHELLELETGAVEAIKMINNSEYLVIIITNQPVLARGECSYYELQIIHDKLHTILGNNGAYLDDLYFCPHHPDKGFEGEVKELKLVCDCRKPEIGMIKKALEKHNVDLQHSWFIGDSTTDIQTGKNAGMKTALVLTGEGGNDKKYNVNPDVLGRNLKTCVEEILNYDTNE